eukprot:GEMP01065912.1.p1 GENE.GEMP01065912.1~~GEMP01065912.1.p1  ORF type:complete len:147 (+),score=14.70 GEMP01065912.1:397-837(+)
MYLEGGKFDAPSAPSSPLSREESRMRKDEDLFIREKIGQTKRILPKKKRNLGHVHFLSACQEIQKIQRFFYVGVIFFLFLSRFFDEFAEMREQFFLLFFVFFEAIFQVSVFGSQFFTPTKWAHGALKVTFYFIFFDGVRWTATPVS